MHQKSRRLVAAMLSCFLRCFSQEANSLMMKRGSISPVLASAATRSSSRLPPAHSQSPSLASPPRHKIQISLTSRLFDSSSDLSPQLRARHPSFNRLSAKRLRNPLLETADCIIDSCQLLVRTRKQPSLRTVEREIKSTITHILSLGKVKRPTVRAVEDPAISKRQLTQLLSKNRHMRLRSWHEFGVSTDANTLSRLR